jgi:hypothetical protein
MTMDDKEKTSDSGGEKPSEIPPGVAENPDVEDPRLYSPMQEADRPSPEERVEQAEEKEQSNAKTDADKSSGEQSG